MRDPRYVVPQAWRPHLDNPGRFLDHIARRARVTRDAPAGVSEFFQSAARQA